MGVTRRLVILAAAGALLAACGPSSAQLKQAREARYQGPRDEVFLDVADAVGKEHPIDRRDSAQAALVTRGRWFEADGTYEDKVVRQEDRMSLTDGAIFLSFTVKVVGDEPPFQVVIEPSVDQVRSGYSAPYHMKPDDPQMPGWVQGKVDDLQLAIHQRLQGRAAVAGAATPAPAPAPSPAP
jgi:hypothetical protein